MAQWITSYNQPNSGPNNGYYNADHIVAIGAIVYGSGYAVQFYTTECGLSEPQYLYVYSDANAAWAKVAELVAATGSVVM
jgi:hypothetical protein